MVWLSFYINPNIFFLYLCLICNKYTSILINKINTLLSEGQKQYNEQWFIKTSGGLRFGTQAHVNMRKP